MGESKGPMAVYLVSLVLFGTNGVVASGIGSLDPQQIILARTLLGSLLLIPLFLILRREYRNKPSRRDAMLTFLSGASMGISWMFQYEAYAEIGIGQTSLIYCLGPVLVLATAPLIFGDRMTVSRILGLTLVLIGSITLSIVGLGEGGSLWGYICAVMTAVGYAGLVIFNKMATGIVGLQCSSLQMLSAFSVTAVYLLIIGDIPTTMASGDLVPVLILGLVNTGFGCLLYFSSTKRISAPTVAICDYLEPVSALALAAILLSEPFGLVDLFGMILILAGALIGVRGAGSRQKGSASVM